MLRTLIVLSAAAALVTTTACGSASSPTSPANTATTSSISLAIGAPSGAGFQITANAAMSDGTTKDVTTSVQWESLSPALATISGSGFVTVLAAGDADFRATYQAVEARTRVAVTQTRYTVSGRVSSAFPNVLQMNNVTVQIVSGPNAGMFTTTDSTGAYALSGLTTGVIDMQASVNGFSTWRLTALSVRTNTRIDPVLYPTPPVNELGLRATGQCNDTTWTYSLDMARVCNAHGGLAWGVCPGPLCETIGNIR